MKGIPGTAIMGKDDFKEGTLTSISFYKNNLLSIFWLYILLYRFDKEKKCNSENIDLCSLYASYSIL